MNSARDKAVRTPAGFNPPRHPPGGADHTAKAMNFWKKNRGLLTRRTFWKVAPLLVANRLQTHFRPPQLRGDPDVVFVSVHHKSMTTYFHAVLKCLAFMTNSSFELVHTRPKPVVARFVLFTHSRLHLDAALSYRGVHVMRDPRDMIVSGYHYHKWAAERWLHRLDENGESYQEKLNRVCKSEGLFLEIDHFIFMNRKVLEEWDLEDENILEVKYEDLMAPGREALYGAIFQHLGFEGRELATALSLMRAFEASSRSGSRSGKVTERSHLRSGRTRQWEDELGAEHLHYIERELGHVIRKFDYPNRLGTVPL
jgi:hypothetical protein